MTAERFIDINADLGEIPEALENGHDEDLMRYVTSANIACGGHAGDEHTMLKTLEIAKRYSVSVGAHPGYPDRENFGRIATTLNVLELERSLAQQIEALRAIANSVRVRVGHVKPHGALYHAANTSSEIARLLAEVVSRIDASMVMVGQAGSPALEMYRERGLRTASEAFADRAYEADGTLRNRKLKGALLDSPDRAARQALELALEGRVTTIAGSTMNVSADTICIHSDTSQSVAIAREIREVLARCGIHVRSLSGNETTK